MRKDTQQEKERKIASDACDWVAVFVSTSYSTLCLVGREEAVAEKPQRPPRRKPPLVTLRLRCLGQHRETQEIVAFFKEGIISLLEFDYVLINVCLNVLFVCRKLNAD